MRCLSCRRWKRVCSCPLFGGTFLPIGKAANDVEDDHRRATKSPWTAEVNGFNVHAGVAVGAGDRQGLERLCRYGARTSFTGRARTGRRTS